MKARVVKLLKGGALICLAGSGYALFCILTGWGLPCLFHQFTGLYCPGCGVSRMCLSLLRLDFAAAFHNNGAVLVLAPLIAVVVVSVLTRYICTGDARPKRWEAAVLYAAIALLLLFGLLRNLPACSFLAPL